MKEELEKSGSASAMAELPHEGLSAPLHARRRRNTETGHTRIDHRPRTLDTDDICHDVRSVYEHDAGISRPL